MSETVWVTNVANRESKPYPYHTDRECWKLGDPVTPRDLDELEADPDYRECRWCDDEYDVDTATSSLGPWKAALDANPEEVFDD